MSACTADHAQTEFESSIQSAALLLLLASLVLGIIWVLGQVRRSGALTTILYRLGKTPTDSMDRDSIAFQYDIRSSIPMLSAPPPPLAPIPVNVTKNQSQQTTNGT
jgi:hypothetical protein